MRRTALPTALHSPSLLSAVVPVTVCVVFACVSLEGASSPSINSCKHGESSDQEYRDTCIHLQEYLLFVCVHVCSGFWHAYRLMHGCKLNPGNTEIKFNFMYQLVLPKD